MEEKNAKLQKTKSTKILENPGYVGCHIPPRRRFNMNVNAVRAITLLVRSLSLDKCVG